MIDKIFNRSSIPLTLADAKDDDFALLRVSDPFCEATGYAPSDCIGKNCRFLQRDDRDQPARFEIRKALDAQADTQVVLRNYTRWGDPFDSLVFIHHIRDLHGDVIYILGSQFVIEARENVKALNRHLRALDENFAMLAASHQSVELNVKRQVSESMSAMLHSAVLKDRLASWNKQ